MRRTQALHCPRTHGRLRGAGACGPHEHHGIKPNQNYAEHGASDEHESHARPNLLFVGDLGEWDKYRSQV